MFHTSSRWLVGRIDIKRLARTAQPKAKILFSLAFGEDGSVQRIFGNLTEYHENLRKRRGAAAAQPYRSRYRTLKR